MNVKETVTQLIKTHETTCPFNLAKQLGIKVEYINLGKRLLGFYNKNSRVPVITINNNANAKQQEFVMGHELGHHIFHHDINTPFMSRNTFFSTDIYEIEAHTFALELLFANKDIITLDDLASYGIPKQLISLINTGK